MNTRDVREKYTTIKSCFLCHGGHLVQVSNTLCLFMEGKGREKVVLMRYIHTVSVLTRVVMFSEPSAGI